MWCSKCHYGSERVVWELDDDGKHCCMQCGKHVEVLTKNPFFGNKNTRTLGGRKVSEKRLPSPKKFQFDQKGGSDSFSPSIVPDSKEDKKQ